MAFIPAIGVALAGGGLLGNVALAAIGIGLNLAIAYFFPQKIKGPRADSLKAQTSKFGDQIARMYGTIRTAGAVIWLRDDKIQEHVRTYRQGKALGPEVTEYSYTATFAVAFAWNGPVSGVPRIWADDKLIYDVSAEALQEAIDTGGSAIGIAKGASIAIYLGTETQQADPDIEADRGAGNVPAWPGVCYVVIKNLPLDEFGIRVPNIEAEITQADSTVTATVTPTITKDNPFNTDCFGEYYATADGTTLHIERLPAASVTAVNTLPYSSNAVHITALNKVVVTYAGQPGMRVFDAATGAFEADVSGVGPATPAGRTTMDDISFGGVNYLFVSGSSHTISLLTNVGLGYGAIWSLAVSGVDDIYSLSASPSRLYGCTDWVFNASKKIIVIEWDGVGATGSEVTLSALNGFARSCFYDEESDSVIITTTSGSIYVYTPDLTTLLRSKVNSFSSSYTDPLASKRMKIASDQIGIKVQTGTDRNDIYLYRVSDLEEIDHIDASASSWDGTGASNRYYLGFNERWQMAFTMTDVNDASTRLWYLPRPQRIPVSLADVIEAECRHAGLTSDASAVPNEIYGIGARNGEAPRGVLEDLCRVNFIDWAQVDGVETFFPRETTAARTFTIADTGTVLNSVPGPIQVTESYPAALDIPEQVIITYPSFDAEYRTGAQAGNTEDDQTFEDEPSQADGDGFPLKVRRNRVMEFSTAQVLTDQDAIRVADVMHNDLRDAATIYKTKVGPKHLDLYPGLVVNVPLDEARVAKAVITKMVGDTVLEMELRKRGDSYVSEAVAQPTPYVVDTLLGPADATPALIDGHLLRAADDNDGFYAGVAVISPGNFRSASIYRSEDGGVTYGPWAGFVNGMIRGIALDALPDRAHPAAFDRVSSFNIAVPVGTVPDGVSESVLLASETSNGFAVWNESVGDWEYIRAASVVDNADGTWTLSTLLRGLRGTEFAMSGHVAGARVYHLDDLAMTRATEGDRTLSRVYVAVPASTAFDSTGAVTFTNNGKGLRCWSPAGLTVTRDGSGNITGTFSRRDRLGQAWPESGAETPPMSEAAESYKVNVYDTGVVVRTITIATESFSYSATDQTTDFGAPVALGALDLGVLQVSAVYGDGVELLQAV